MSTTVNVLGMKLFNQLQLLANNNMTAFPVDGTSVKCACVFQAPEDATITTVGMSYYTDTATGTTTYRVSLQGLDSSGNPDGTVLGGGSPASVTFTPPSNSSWDTTARQFTLTNSYALTKGQIFAIVWDYSSGTCNGSNCSYFYHAWNSVDRATAGFPYTLTYSPSSWTRYVNAPTFSYSSASKTYGMPALGHGSTATGTNGYRTAIRFKVPASFPQFTIAGIRYIGTPSSAGTYKIGIWDSTGTAVQVATATDTDAMRTNANTSAPVDAYFDNATLATLDPDTTYYLGIERVDVAQSIRHFTVGLNSDLSAYFPGVEAYLGTWNGSSWTTTTTTRPMIEPILGSLIISAGGGGKLIGPSNLVSA